MSLNEGPIPDNRVSADETKIKSDNLSSETLGPVDDNDPFSEENAPMLNFIMSARIYDVLLALLTHENKALAKNLIDIHSQGGLMGPSPSFMGSFISDEVNSTEEE